MRAGATTRSLPGRALRLTAAALVAACWLAAPAGAAGLLGDGHPPQAVAPGAAADGIAAATTQAAAPAEAAASAQAGSPAHGAVKTVAAARPALQAAVRGVAETVSDAGPAVRRATETVAAAGPGAKPSLDAAIRRTAPLGGGDTSGRADGGTAASQASPGGALGPLRDRHPVGQAAGSVSVQAARLQARRVDRVLGPNLPLRELLRSPTREAPIAPTAERSLPAPVNDAADEARAAPGSPPPPSTTAGGTPFSSAATGFSLGGLALLLATLSMAGPALRRRLPSRTATAWPAAFVPLLERPG
jgi:hypothetical protein